LARSVRKPGFKGNAAVTGNFAPGNGKYLLYYFAGIVCHCYLL